MISIKSIIGGAFLALGALMLCQTSALAQDSPDRMPRPAIRVTGDAIVMAKPDQAQIDIGVITQAANAQAAATENARKLDAVLTALRRALGPQADIKTISYSLNPNYRYPREGGQPTITGYTASNTVQVKTSDLTQVGKIIDTATSSGANNVQALRFMLKDEQAVRAQALKEAATEARSKAEALASALGVRVMRILLVEESGPVVRPVYQAEVARAMTADAAPTPVEPGAIEVRAVVTLTVEITQ